MVFRKNDLVRYTIRKALGLSVDDIELASIVGTTNLPSMRRAVSHVADKLVTEKNGHLRCGLCGRGPFTRRGLYLHLTRVHSEEILELINSYIEETE
ncbi:MAG: hypothetical protein ABWW65_05075 [Thermoprotei archaeon]